MRPMFITSLPIVDSAVLYDGLKILRTDDATFPLKLHYVGKKIGKLTRNGVDIGKAAG